MHEKFYANQKRAVGYAHRAYLYKPEETVLNELKHKLSDMVFLDIGVGGGRTTIHFAPLVKKYIGTDYSEAMIKECINHIGEQFDNVKLYVEDARLMTSIQDNSIDFVLFSFNGIDEMELNDRFKVYRNVKRILKKDGYFLFSSHNILNLEQKFKFRFQKNLYKLLRNNIRLARLKRKNENLNEIKSKEYAKVFDYLIDFSHWTYYTHYKFIIQELHKHGFKGVRIYRNSNGILLGDNEEIVSDEPWLYYLARAE